MTNVPGWPVILNNGTSTKYILYLDYYLKSLISNVPHILEETRDFVNHIQDLLDRPESSIPVYFNVVGLFPYIPHEEGIEYLK